jgi:type 2 lantibiotic biosynthesis protein LanM
MKENPMYLTEPELAQLAANASTLHERMSGEFTAVATPDDLLQQRISRWFQNAAGGDEEKFQRRLAWDGIFPQDLLGLIGEVQLDSLAKLPAWVSTLDNSLLYFSAFSRKKFDSKQILNTALVLLPDAPLPFEDILYPMVCYAWERLVAQIDLKSTRLSEQAQADLARQLMWRLSRICTTPLMGELAWLRTQNNPLSLFASKRNRTGSSVLYQQLVREMFAGKLKTFLMEYAFLARLIITTIDQWLAVTLEFIERLERDTQILDETFGLAGTQLASIETDLSDMHHGMRSVYSLTFSSGTQLVYKPKRVRLDKLFQEFLTWLNQHSESLNLKTFIIVDRDEYGWMQFVSHSACRDKESIAHYYQRIGRLLSIEYVLNGTDCHVENIIASGEHPVLIDLETLIMPDVNTMVDGAEDILALATAPMRNSVLFTGMLPDWHPANNGDAYNAGGLGGVYIAGQTTQIQLWQYVNTDDMAFEPVFVKTSPPSSMPYTTEGEQTIYYDASQYVQEITAGFQAMYQTLLSLKDSLLTETNPLYQLSSQSMRFIFRATESYGLLMNRVVHPRFLRSGIDWSLELEALCRPMLNAAQKNPFWAMIRSEQEAITQLDIPLFIAEMTSCDLITDQGETVQQAFTLSGQEALGKKIGRLNSDDLQQQIMFIENAFDAFNAVEESNLIEFASEAPIESTYKPISTSEQRLSSEAAIHYAADIGKIIRQRALTVKESSFNWVNIGFMADCHRYRLEAMGDTLYEGLTGVGLFLAALDCYVGGYRDLALGAVQNIRTLIQKPDTLDQMLGNVSIGAGSGIASMVYALTKMSQFLQTPELLNDAHVLAQLITPQRIEADPHFDVIAGSAGAILGLLSLDTLKGDPILLERAVLCGQHLVKSRVITDKGLRAWPNSDGICLAGFSHGAGGISYALLRLYELTRDETLLEAASEAIAYERTLFMPEFGNWADMRSPGESGLMTSWCHGAPGIGLARIGGLSSLNTPEIQKDIDIALATTKYSLWSDVDHLCCGMFGKIDVLLTAGQRLNRPDLLDTAYSTANWIVEQANELGGYRTLSAVPRRAARLGLFQGLAGIGYELLRFANPDQLPSLLLWE